VITFLMQAGQRVPDGTLGCRGDPGCPATTCGRCSLHQAMERTATKRGMLACLFDLMRRDEPPGFGLIVRLPALGLERSLEVVRPKQPARTFPPWMWRPGRSVRKRQVER